MLGVKISLGNEQKIIYTFDEGATAEKIGQKVTELTGITSQEFYVVHNGRLARDSDICENGTAEIIPRLLGGKGGFGSMLRAIGAQIEKTTNREACRDLSGRRLRDINEEKRLKSWIDKQGAREEEAVERKKKKLERLCAQPRHEFKDKNYEKERSTLTEKVGDAVEEGFKLAMAGSSGEKRKANDDKGRSGRKRLALDSDIDSDELGSSSDESDSDSHSKPKAESSSSSRSTEDSREIKSGDAKTEDSGELHKVQPSARESESPDTDRNSDGSNNSVKSLENKGVAKVAVTL